MNEILDLIVKTYGVVGLLIAAPFYATIHLWKDNLKMRAEHKAELKALNDARVLDSEKNAKLLSEANDKLVKAQEQRVVDAVLVRDKLVDMVAEQSAMTRETNIVMDQVGEFLAAYRVRLLPPGGS